MSPAVKRIAVVGAGISGLVAARHLSQRGCEVRVLERARGVGGRTAHRRAGEHHFDHGAQYFTVRDARFAEAVTDWLAADVVAPWHARVVAMNERGQPTTTSTITRYVGVPGMNAMANQLSAGLEVMTECEVTQVTRNNGVWRVYTNNGETFEPFDALVLAMTPEQAARVLAPKQIPTSVVSLPCWCAMVAFEMPLPLDFDGAFVNDSIIDWAARDSSKPGRPDGERWIIHAASEWSSSRLQLSREAVAATLLEAFFDRLGVDHRASLFLSAHRWSLARPASHQMLECCWLPKDALAVCGDWCLGGRVEGAYLSGIAAASCVGDAAAVRGMC